MQLDSSHEMLHRDEDIPVDGSERCGTYLMVADEEAKMPFPDGTFDLVLSSVSMHWINELPALFSEVKVSQALPQRLLFQNELLCLNRCHKEGAQARWLLHVCHDRRYDAPGAESLSGSERNGKRRRGQSSRGSLRGAIGRR